MPKWMKVLLLYTKVACSSNMIELIFLMNFINNKFFFISLFEIWEDCLTFPCMGNCVVNDQIGDSSQESNFEK